MSQTSHPIYSPRQHGVVAVWAALILAALTLVAGVVSPGVQQAEAQTSSNDGVNFGDCSFRRGTGVAEAWANQMCWLDMSDMTTAGPKTKKVGDYTITFNLRIESKNTTTRFTANSNPTWNGAAFAKTGSGFFERYPSSTSQDILQMEGSKDLIDRLREGDPFARFTLSNIVVKRNGVADPLASYRFAVVDGESTGAGSPGEMISVDGGTVGQPVRLTPPNAKEACTGGRNAKFGPGAEPTGWEAISDGRQRGFVCYSQVSGTYGTWVVGVDNPKTLQISMASDASGTQGFALGLAVSRIAFDKDGSATVQDAFEKVVDPVERTASYSAFLQDGSNRTTLSTPAGGSTTALRRVGSNGVPVDQLGYTSTLSPADRAFVRYDPVWKCTLTSGGTNSETYLIRKGSVPAGYTLTENTQTGTSTLLIPAAEARVPNCSVTWESKFKPAKLNLSKTVDGNAANFAENSLQKYTLHYRCTVPEGFTTAYPDVKLEDDVVVEKGRSASVDSLPPGQHVHCHREGSGAACRHETRALVERHCCAVRFSTGDGSAAHLGGCSHGYRLGKRQ